MKIGLQIPSFTWAGGSPIIGQRLSEIAQTAEQNGFTSIWVMDHFFQIRGVGQRDEPMLEGYTALAYMAGLTHQVKLGTMVTGVIYRNPGLLAKIVSSLDVLSGGRAYLGIGAAWNEEESLGLGFTFPSIKERFERLEEALQIIYQMWSGKESPYQGRYFKLERTLNNPQPISRPHPPILIGGSGEKKTLKLVAKYGNACNLFGRVGKDILTHKLDVLKSHCDKVGRNYNEIEKTILDTVHLAPGMMTPKEMVASCREYSQLGFQHIIINMPNVADIKPIELIGNEVIPAVKNL